MSHEVYVIYKNIEELIKSRGYTTQHEFLEEKLTQLDAIPVVPTNPDTIEETLASSPILEEIIRHLLYLGDENVILDNQATNNIEQLYDLLAAVRDGTGTIEDFYAAVERVRGAGPEITAAVDDLAIAMEALPADLTQEPSAQAERFLAQAEEQLANIATAIGGLDAEIQAAADAQSLPEKVEALEALAAGLQSAQLAGNLVRGSSWISDTADLLKALQDARDLEQSMMEALGANATRLNELATEAERFRVPIDGAAAGAGQTEATLDRINFTPLENGARGFADQLVRAAQAALIINNMETPSGGGTAPPIMASVTRDAVGTNGLATLNSGGSFMVGGNGGIDQNLIAFWASKGEMVTVTPRGQSLMDGADRSGQSEEYLNTIQLINQELETRYDNIMRNNQGMQQQQILQDALRIAQQEGTVLAREDIALIEQRANALAQLEQRMQLIEDIGDAVFNNLESALNNFVETGTFNFNEFASSVIKDLARIGIQMMIIAPLKNFFGGVLANNIFVKMSMNFFWLGKRILFFLRRDVFIHKTLISIMFRRNFRDELHDIKCFSKLYQ